MIFTYLENRDTSSLDDAINMAQAPFSTPGVHPLLGTPLSPDTVQAHQDRIDTIIAIIDTASSEYHHYEIDEELYRNIRVTDDRSSRVLSIVTHPCITSLGTYAETAAMDCPELQGRDIYLQHTPESIKTYMIAFFNDEDLSSYHDKLGPNILGGDELIRRLKSAEK